MPKLSDFQTGRSIIIFLVIGDNRFGQVLIGLNLVVKVFFVQLRRVVWKLQEKGVGSKEAFLISGKFKSTVS